MVQLVVFNAKDSVFSIIISRVLAMTFCFQVNNECERETFVDNPLQDESFTHVEGNVYENLYSFPPANDSESFQHRGVAVDESNLGEPLGMVLFLLKK